MVELAIALISIVTTWLVTRRLESGKRRLSTTLELMEAFNSDPMLLHRIKVWNGRERIFAMGTYDEALIRCDPDTLDSDHPVFHLTALLWFFRKVALLANMNQISKKECRGLFGSQFEMFWTHVFLKVRGGGSEAHSLLWRDLDTLEWLRDGFSSPHLVGAPVKGIVEH